MSPIDAYRDSEFPRLYLSIILGEMAIGRTHESKYSVEIECAVGTANG